MTMPPRLTVIGEIERRDHFHLSETASCYFWGEYTPYENTNGLKWNFSPTNQLVSNFKKKMDRAGAADWRYKLTAIQTVSRQFSSFWKWKELHEVHRVALIPVPPSKGRNSPLYDGRMLEVLKGISQHSGIALDIRDCLSLSGRYGASHEAEVRPAPDDLYADLTFDAATGGPQHPPGVIFLFDDMLTTGAHYEAVRRKLSEIYPGVAVVGNFIARRILPNPFDDFDILET